MIPAAATVAGAVVVGGEIAAEAVSEPASSTTATGDAPIGGLVSLPSDAGVPIVSESAAGMANSTAPAAGKNGFPASAAGHVTTSPVSVGVEAATIDSIEAAGVGFETALPETAGVVAPASCAMTVMSASLSG